MKNKETKKGKSEYKDNENKVNQCGDLHIFGN